MTDNLALFGNKMLQTAIRENLVSVPAQVPVFPNSGGDVQARMAQLYFFSGWTIAQLCERYATSGETVRKYLTEWRVRAVSSGYIEDIGPQSVIPRENEGRVEAPLQLVPARVISLPAADTSSCDDVPFALLEAIQTGVDGVDAWPPFRLRLLAILRQECIGMGLHYSAAQICRIEAAAAISSAMAHELLHDLEDRLRDEQETLPQRGVNSPDRMPLMRLLLEEIRTCVQETNAWQPHCNRLLDVIRQGCRELGLKFSLRQLDRLRDAIAATPGRISDAVRELRNRLEDERSCEAPAHAVDYNRQLSVGNGR